MTIEIDYDMFRRMQSYVWDRLNQAMHTYSYRRLETDRQQLEQLNDCLGSILAKSKIDAIRDVKAQSFIIKGEDGNFYQAVKEVPIPYGQV
jgi:hypothetical protein